MMSERPEKTAPSSAQRRDESLGRALSGTLSAEDAGACPPPEELAALCEGRLGDAARDALQRHLAVCERCYQVYTLTAELLPAPKTASGRRWLWVPAALATAAALVLAIRFFWPASIVPPEQVARLEAPAAAPALPPAAAPPAVETTMPQTPQTPQASTSATAKGEPPARGRTGDPAEPVLAAARRLAVHPAALKAITAKEATAFGFAAEERPAVQAFRLGGCALDLELALAMRDRPAARRVLERTVLILRELEPQGDRRELLHRLEEQLETGAGPEGLAGGSGKLAEAASAQGLLPYWRLGAWAEGARIAAEISAAGYFSPAEIRSLAAALPAGEAEDQARRLLEGIARVAGGAEEGDKLQRKRLIAELITLF
jgi:hypothetical protein